jgi:hypothetical protein
VNFLKRSGFTVRYLRSEEFVAFSSQ